MPQKDPFTKLLIWLSAPLAEIRHNRRNRDQQHTQSQPDQQKTFIKAAKTSEFTTDGEPILVTLENKKIAMVRWSGNYYAMDNSCPHIGAPLSRGKVVDREGKPSLQCPLHKSAFNLETGDVTEIPAKDSVKTYETRVSGDGGTVELAL